MLFPEDDKLKKSRHRFESQILRWNQMFPIDIWWRNKHSVSFGSSLHKEMSFFDMLFEYYEQRFFERAAKKEENGKTDETEYEMAKDEKTGEVVFVDPKSRAIKPDEATDNEFFDSLSLDDLDEILSKKDGSGEKN